MVVPPHKAYFAPSAVQDPGQAPTAQFKGKFGGQCDHRSSAHALPGPSQKICGPVGGTKLKVESCKQTLWNLKPLGCAQGFLLHCVERRAVGPSQSRISSIHAFALLCIRAQPPVQVIVGNFDDDKQVPTQPPVACHVSCFAFMSGHVSS